MDTVSVTQQVAITLWCVIFSLVTFSLVCLMKQCFTVCITGVTDVVTACIGAKLIVCK